MTFEKKLERLEKTIEKIEDGATGLEKSVSLYKDGIALAKECGEMLGKFEEEVLLLQKTADGFSTQPFDEDFR